MFRIDHPSAVAERPARLAAGAPGFFARPVPGVQAPTRVTTDWLNDIQEELCGVVEAAGLDLEATNVGQLLQAIQIISSGGASVAAGPPIGMNLANAIGNPTTRITIAYGVCRDSLNSVKIVLPEPLTKRLDQAWAAGNNAGGRDAGALANGQTWHVFAIYNPDTLAVDALYSQSPTAPTLPAGFTKFRRLGAIVLEAASTAIREFTQVGNWFFYKKRSTDYAVQSNGGGVAYLRTVAVPMGIRVRASLYFQSTGTANATAYLSGVFDPAFGVPAAFGGPEQRAAVRRVAAYQQASGQDLSYGTVDGAICATDTAAHVYTFSSDNSDVIALGVIGWEDLREMS